MRREEIEKLLGGYATDSLTPEERRELLTAALEDQSLFDELAREDALREVLSDPSSRAEILAALDGGPSPWYRRFAQWLGRPAGLAALAGTTAAVVTLGVLINYRSTHLSPALVTEVRKMEERRPDVAPPAAEVAPSPRPSQVATQVQSARGDSKPTSLATHDSPKAVEAPAARSLRSQDATGVVGGVPGGVAGSAPGGVVGGVIGGIVPRQDLPPAPPPTPGAAPPEKKEVASADSARENQLAPMRAAAPAPPAPPPRVAKARAEAETQVAPSTPGTAALSARALFEAPQPVNRFREESSDLRSPEAGLGINRRLSAGKAKKTAAPAAMMASAVNVPHLGLRYSVLRVASERAFTEIDPATVFERGDQVRLAFEANDSGYLYVLQREAGGGWRQLFGDRIERRVRRVVPAEGALVYDEPGTKQLYVFFSRVAEPGLATLNPSLLDDRVRGSQLVQKGDDRSVYVVNTSSAPQSQQLGHTITLTYR